ncbi:MAG: hypothetical protein K8R16_02455 [Anaerolineales bacterium]|nr:hypothetical protein [Anaerolineales bacterium]
MSKLALAVLSALLTLMAACRGAELDTAVLADGPTTVPTFTESTALHYVDKLTEIWGKGKTDITFFQFDESYNIPPQLSRSNHRSRNSQLYLRQNFRMDRG